MTKPQGNTSKSGNKGLKKYPAARSRVEKGFTPFWGGWNADPLWYIHRHLWLHRASAPRWVETPPSCCSGRTDPSAAACQKGASPGRSGSTTPYTSAGEKPQTKHQKQRICLSRKASAPPQKEQSILNLLLAANSSGLVKAYLSFPKSNSSQCCHTTKNMNHLYQTTSGLIK